MKKVFMRLFIHFEMMFLPNQRILRIAITDGQWSSRKNLKAVENMKEWEVTELNLDENGRVQIIKDLSHITFTRLKILSLWGNQLHSIEGIINLHLPLLQNLQLSQNHINSIKILRKASWHSLYTLTMFDNYIYDHKVLTEASFPVLQCLWLLYYNKKKDRFFDPFFPSKLQTRRLLKLRLQSHKISLSPSIEGVLENKWRNIQIK